jgi:hypothetical protein
MALPTTRLQQAMDYATLINSLNQNFALLENLNVAQTFKDEMGVNRIQLGKQPDGTYGLKVSQPGIDVLTATDDQLVFNSNNNLFKITLSGELDISVPVIPSGTDWSFAGASIDHDLGYSPMIIAFVTYDSPQSVGTYTTRLFGTGIVNALSVSGSGVTIGYVSQEEISANEFYINVNWKISNGTLLAAPPFTAKLRYYCLTTTVG